MSLRETVFAMTISSLDLGSVDSVMIENNYRNRYREVNGTKLERALQVGDVVRLFGPYRAGFKPDKRTRAFLSALRRLGLTRLDVHYLPLETVTAEVLATYAPQELLQLPALGVTDWYLLHGLYLATFERSPQEVEVGAITIGDMLRVFGKTDKGAVARASRHIRSHQCREYFLSTRTRLGQIFEPKECPFLRLGSIADELEYALDWGYPKTHAHSIVDFNVSTGLVPGFLY